VCKTTQKKAEIMLIKVVHLRQKSVKNDINKKGGYEQRG